MPTYANHWHWPILLNPNPPRIAAFGLIRVHEYGSMPVIGVYDCTYAVPSKVRLLSITDELLTSSQWSCSYFSRFKYGSTSVTRDLSSSSDMKSSYTWKLSDTCFSATGSEAQITLFHGAGSCVPLWAAGLSDACVTSVDVYRDVVRMTDRSANWRTWPQQIRDLTANSAMPIIGTTTV